MTVTMDMAPGKAEVDRMRDPKARRPVMARTAVVLAALFILSGCGLFAAPCRVASAGLKIVPLVGQVAAAPTDGCANVIDPTPTRS
jgi:hypothetical protein